MAILIALTAAWEVYAIRGVSEAGVGFLEVALGVPAAVLLAVGWACAWSADGSSGRARIRRMLLGFSFPVLAGALVLIPLNPLFRLRFAVSQAALTRFAQELERGRRGSSRFGPGCSRPGTLPSCRPRKCGC